MGGKTPPFPLVNNFLFSDIELCMLSLNNHLNNSEHWADHYLEANCEQWKREEIVNTSLRAMLTAQSRWECQKVGICHVIAINITGIWLKNLLLFIKQWFFTDIMQNFDRYPPICIRLPILHIGRYVSAGMITDTDISVLPIWAISADISFRPIPICQPWCKTRSFPYLAVLCAINLYCQQKRWPAAMTHCFPLISVLEHTGIPAQVLHLFKISFIDGSPAIFLSPVG